MAGRFCRIAGRYTGLWLLFVDPAFGCEDNCPKSTESIALSVILCIAAVAAIICPLLCLFGPFKQLAIRWRIFLHDKLGWEYPQRNQSHQSHQRQFQVEYEVSTGNDVPPEYVNIAFVDLPPSYDEVVKNSQYYKYGPASEHHYQRQDSQESPRTETCHQISRRLEYVLEPSLITVPNASVQEPREQTNNTLQLSSISIQNASVTDIQEPSEQTNNMNQLSSITIRDANLTNVQEPGEQSNITHQSRSVTDPSAPATTDHDSSERSINVH